MSNLLVAKILHSALNPHKVKPQTTKSENSPTDSSSDEKVRQFNDKNSYETYVNTVFESAVLQTIAENPEAFEIFKKIVNNTENLVNNEIAEVQNQILSLAPTCVPLHEVVKAIREMGFSISNPSEQEINYVVPSSKEKTGYAIHTHPKVAAFNGIELTPEQIQNGENPYRERLDQFEEEHPNLSKELTTAQKTVNRLSKNKFLLKLFGSRRYKLEKAVKKLEELKELSETRQTYTTQSEFFDGLTPDDKQVLLDYFDLKSKIAEELSPQLYDLRNDILFKMGYNNGYEEYIQERIASAGFGLLQPEEQIYFNEFCLNMAQQFSAMGENEAQQFNKKVNPIMTPTRIYTQTSDAVCIIIDEHYTNFLEQQKEQVDSANETKNNPSDDQSEQA